MKRSISITAIVVLSVSNTLFGGEQPPTASATGSASPAQAQGDDLVKQLANPVASLISVPFQANWDFGIGLTDATRFTLNVQPVVPLYHVLKGTMNNYNVMVRGILRGGMENVGESVEVVRKMRIYPWSERANPKPTKFISFSGKTMDTLPPQGMEYWARLSAFINNNPVQDRDLFFMAMLKPLGIEKGKPFKPDARQKAILEEAASVGDAMGRAMLFDAEHRFTKIRAFPNSQWDWVVIVEPDQQSDAPVYGQIDERLHYTYGAIYTAPGIGVKKAGPGSTYVQVFKDKDGNRLDGGKSYRLHIPKDAPAASFWSVTLYDTGTRSMIQNANNDSAKSSYDKLKINADGSVDLYFAPKAPAGQESNWIETVPGKGFYPMMRFYSPKEGLFDGTWKLPDIELVK